MKKRIILMLGLLCLLLSTGCQNQDYATPGKDIGDTFPLNPKTEEQNPQLAESTGPYALIQTTAGEITVLLYPNEAPKAVENFIALANEGYYEESIFHYVVKDAIVQGGLPKNGEERSYTGEPLEDELSDQLHHFHGALSMANHGINTSQSQFFFVASQEIPENEKLISSNMYMNELIREETLNLNQINRENKMSDEEISAFEVNLNQKIQEIGISGVPEEALSRYKKAMEGYQAKGGAYHLDYNNTVFGQVIKGLNIVDSLSKVFVDTDRKPKKEIKIESIKIVENLGDIEGNSVKNNGEK
ncbi:MAG: peptidylprolyl isomerase [Eubacteriaceae bacterium]